MSRIILIVGLVALFSFSFLSATGSPLDNSPEIQAQNIKGDLYKVMVQSRSDADRLAATGVAAIMRIQDGYLVLADPASVAGLLSSGLQVELIAREIAKNQLALDNRLDRMNIGKFEILYEEGQLRLFKIDPQEIARMVEPPQLAQLPASSIKIEYMESRQIGCKLSATDLDLDSLISLINQDSLESYVSRLQAFYRRPAGSDSNYASRDWIVSKLVAFGYDSIIIDSFSAKNAQDRMSCQNVLAYKVGTRLPNRHLVVGAHRDGVPDSPAADDNGSGTAAVLEAARILKDIETNVTFVFALFDAEEDGLLGSYHYVDEATAAGDSIFYMMDFDMIADQNNETQATLYHGSDLTYTLLWQTLADSLMGIGGVLSGNSGGSDHYPFTQAGIPATFVSEYNFSTVYHSPRDSTTYMSFTYMTNMVKASLATLYVASQTYAKPAVVFSYPVGIPTALSATGPTEFEVTVSGINDGIPVSGTGRLHYSVNGGAYNDIPMTEVEANSYKATFPSLDCESRVSFYVSAEETDNGTFFDPDTNNPFWAGVGNESIPFADNFELSLGWTVSGDAVDGQWTRGIPIGGGQRGDPPTDFDGSGRCYLTDNVAGNSDVDNGTTYLTSPRFDLSGKNGLISYARWYSNSFGAAPFADVMKIYISNNDGANWTLVETIGPTEQTSGGWFKRTFWANEYITSTDKMKLRFEASDLGDPSVVEAGVDAVRVSTYTCAQFTCGDANRDGVTNTSDAVFVINYVFVPGSPAPEPFAAGDANCDDQVNVSDAVYVINYVFVPGSPVPCASCP